MAAFQPAMWTLFQYSVPYFSERHLKIIHDLTFTFSDRENEFMDVTRKQCRLRCPKRLPTQVTFWVPALASSCLKRKLLDFPALRNYEQPSETSSICTKFEICNPPS